VTGKVELTRALLEVYDRLARRFGPQDWWPADGPFEVAVGAILTQAVSWSNVERAVANLKRHNVLSPEGLRDVDETELAGLVRPTGYYNAKARKLKSFARYLWDRYDGHLERMFSEPADLLRRELLEVHGIGEETADSIMLYAGGIPVFVVDAYTRRIATRMGLVDERASYREVQRMFLDALPRRADLFNEYHALFVALGKEICLKRAPLCESCPLSTRERRTRSASARCDSP